MAIPTGQVVLYDQNNNALQSGGLDSNGNASFTLTNLPVGTAGPFTVQYRGDGGHNPTVSNSLPLTVNPAKVNTSATISGSPDPSTQGQAVVISVSVVNA